jgi:hypothetical protein
MGLSVLVPENAAYTLYARGEAAAHAVVPGRGTFITFSDDSTVILFYKYFRHRRAYIVRDVRELKHYQGVRLPGVKEPVGIIAKLKGRRIDILRRAYFNLEKINGLEVYRYSVRFWQRLGCLIDNYNGHKTAAIKSNLMELSRRYAQDGTPEISPLEGSGGPTVD